MKVNNTDLAQKARNYAFLLLKFRLRSEKEISERLKRKKYPQDIVKATLSFLKEKGFVNDHEFTRAWLESRLKKPLGLRRLRQELKLKGIDDEIVAAQIQGLSDDYNEEEIVQKLIRDKLNKLKNIEADKAKRRIYSYLLRRGFSAETVLNLLRNVR